MKGLKKQIDSGELDILQAARVRWGGRVAVGQTVPEGKRKVVCMVLLESAGRWVTIGSGSTWGAAFVQASKLTTPGK